MSAPHVSDRWPEEKIRRLRAAWDEGWTANQIGVRMGISKNAVVGKAHRLDLPSRPSPIKRGDGTPRPRKSCAKRAPAITLDALICLAADTITPKLEPEVAAMRKAQQPKPVVVVVPQPPQRTCQFIEGSDDKRTWRKCGQPVDTAYLHCPYCVPHRRRCWTNRVRDIAA